VRVSGLQLIPSPAGAAALHLSHAEESDLVRVGDYVLGVAGTATAGMTAACVGRAIAAARAATPGGLVVLHLSDVPLEGAGGEEAALQIAAAALQLMGARGLLEAAQDAIVRALSAPAAAVTVALDEDARAASGRVLPL
jgi:hypothetical protein